MPDRKGLDPVDSAINSAFGWIVGRSITGWLALVDNQNTKKRQKEIEKQRILKLPDSMESSRAVPLLHGEDSPSALDRALARSMHNGVQVIWAVSLGFALLLGLTKGVLAGLVAGVVCLAIGFSLRKLVPASLWGFFLTDLPEATVDAQPASRSRRLVRRAYTIRLSPKGEWRAIYAGEFMTTLLARFTGIAFQIEATHEDIVWRIVDLRCDADPSSMTTAIRSFYPDAEVTWTEEAPPTADRFFYRYVMQFEHLQDFLGPMKRVADLKASDPLVPMAQDLNSLLPGERVVYSLYVSEWARFAHEQMPNFLYANPPKHPLGILTAEGLYQAVANAGLSQQSMPIYPPEDMRVLLTKAQVPLYLSFLMVQVDALTPERVLALSHFDGYMRQLDEPAYNGIAAAYGANEAVENVVMAAQDEASSIEGIIERWVNGASRDWQQHSLILDAGEIAALWHLPTKEYSASKIAWNKPQVFVPIPKTVPKVNEGICLGYNGDPALGIPVFMPLANRTTHMAVIGRTGTGKSTLLHNLIHQDIAAGRGLAVIDPHGTLVREVLERSIPPEREADVVLLDFAQEDYPPPLNPLLVPEGAVQLDAANRMMTLIERIYHGFEGQMADTLYMTLLTLMHEQTPTLRDVTRLFNDPRYRYRLTEQLDNAAAEDFWDTFNHLSQGEQTLRRGPVEHRLRKFYGNPALYPILCHPKTLDFPTLIREQRIVLVSLETKRRGIPPADARLLGAILVANFQMAVMGLAAMEHGFAVYIDEAEDFVTTALDEMMAESRFANLSLVLANQYLQQLAGDTLEAVLANIGALAAFQCYEADAKVLLPYLRPHYELEDLLNVDAHQAALWMRTGKQQAVMSLSTAPKPERPKDADERVARIRAQSIENYTPMAKDEVLTWLRERYPKAAPPPDDEAGWYDKDTP